MMVWSFFILDITELFLQQIGFIISIGNLPTANIIVPYFLNIESNLTKTNVHCIIEWLEILNERG